LTFLIYTHEDLKWDNIIYPPEDIKVSQLRHFCIILFLQSDILLGVSQHLKSHGNGYILLCVLQQHLKSHGNGFIFVDSAWVSVIFVIFVDSAWVSVIFVILTNQNYWYQRLVPYR
jgi:hypothetical protein